MANFILQVRQVFSDYSSARNPHRHIFVVSLKFGVSHACLVSASLSQKAVHERGTGSGHTNAGNNREGHAVHVRKPMNMAPLFPSPHTSITQQSLTHTHTHTWPAVLLPSSQTVRPVLIHLMLGKIKPDTQLGLLTWLKTNSHHALQHY